MKFVKLRRAAVVAVFVATAVGISAPAYATNLNGDWNQSPESCESSCSVTQGNLVQMWQGIIWVLGYGTGTCNSFVDGHFGPNTTAATRAFQSHYTPSGVDGRVGPNTWSAAWNLVVRDGGGTNVIDYRITGSKGYVQTYLNTPPTGADYWTFGVYANSGGTSSGSTDTDSWPTIGPKVGCFPA